MGTNSGCSCVEDKPRHELRSLLWDRQYLLARVERLEAALREIQVQAKKAEHWGDMWYLDEAEEALEDDDGRTAPAHRQA
jgi:hypothetical protein